MFDFEKLDVYQKARAFNKLISVYIINFKRNDATAKDQLRRASLSIMLNIAEGSSRFSHRDRKNFFIISRGSAFECAALMDFLVDEGQITHDEKAIAINKLEEISKMLFAMIKNLSKTNT